MKNQKFEQYNQQFMRIMENDTARLPTEMLNAFIDTFPARRNRFLSLLEHHASPLYVFEPDVLKNRASQFRGAFEREISDVGFFFAMKSNNHPVVSQHIVEAGFGLDVSSGYELTKAIEASPQEVIMSGPGKTERELQLAVEHAGLVTVLMDSFAELSRLERIAAAAKRRIRAGIRLTTNPNGLWRKFGIPLCSLGEFFREATRCEWVNLAGIQFHTSWNRDPNAQRDFIGELGKNLSCFPPSMLEKIQFIDIGGGYWPPQGEWLQFGGTPKGALLKTIEDERPAQRDHGHYWMEAKSIDHFAREIADAINEHLQFLSPLRILTEPGRWICNDSMHLLLTVVDKKGDDIVITDGGTNAIGWERFESDFFPVLNLSRPSKTEKSCMVLGSLCTPHDVFGYSYFGEDIQIGDVLLVPTQGAYTISLSQNFIKPVPQVVTF